MTYLPILTYHRLLAEEPTPAVDPKRIAVSVRQFRRQLRWLTRLGYRTIRLADYIEDLRAHRAPPRGAFAITFDDGYQDVLTLGLPILQELGLTATVFAVPGQSANRWDDGTVPLMDRTQIVGWRRAGMEVGAHTCAHVHLAQVSPNRARQEIHEARQQLEDQLGEPVTLFAYPYGESNRMVEDMVRDAGYTAGFATDRAPRDHAANLYRLRRAVVFPRNTSWEILWKAQRWYPAYQDWKRGG